MVRTLIFRRSSLFLKLQSLLNQIEMIQAVILMHTVHKVPVNGISPNFSSSQKKFSGE